MLENVNLNGVSIIIVVTNSFIRSAALDRCDTVTQTQSNSLCFGTNANISSQLPIVIFLLLHRYIYQCILTKNAFAVFEGAKMKKRSSKMSESYF